MRNLRELKTILSCLFYINRISDNENVDIKNLLDYAFDRIFDCNTNLLMLACIGQTKESAMPEIFEILKAETKYYEFIKRKEDK